MPLTDEQVAIVQEHITWVESSESGFGEVTIVIENHHPRWIWQTVKDRLPPVRFDLTKTTPSKDRDD